MTSLRSDVASSMFPENSFCVTTKSTPGCPSKGDPVVAKNADGSYSIIGHLSLTNRCVPSGSGSAVFTNVTSKDGVEFLKSAVEANAATTTPVPIKVASTPAKPGNEDPVLDISASKRRFMCSNIRDILASRQSHNYSWSAQTSEPTPLTFEQ